MKNLPRSVLFEEAEKLGLGPKKIATNGLFTIDYKNKTAYIYYTYTHLNSQLGATFASNKYLTRIMAEQINIKNIPYIYTDNKNDIQKFFEQHKGLIIKPLAGSQAMDVNLIQTQQELTTALQKLALEEYIFEKYISGVELKHFIFNGKVIGITKKTLDSTPKDQWRKTQATILEKNTWNNEIVKASEKLAQLMGLSLCTVDYILTSNNTMYLLEVNSRVALIDFYTANEKIGKKVAQKMLITILTNQLGNDFYEEYKYILQKEL